MTCLVLVPLVVAAFVVCMPLVALAVPEPPLRRQLQKMSTERLEQLLIPAQDRNITVDVEAALFEAQGKQEVIVQLRSPSVAAPGSNMSPSDCTKHKNMLEEEQTSFLNRCEAPSAQELGCLHILLNAVFLSIDAEDIEALALDPDVISIHRVANFEKNLERRVPYIGANVMQEQYGYNGTGVRVAILDSGIDYTHIELGGPGTREAWEAAYKNFSSRDGLFPTEKVVEGFDFVGEV